MTFQRYHWRALEHAATDAIRSNLEIVAIAAAQDWRAMQYANKSVVRRSNPEIASILCAAAAQQDGNALQYVPDELQQSNPTMVHDALQRTSVLHAGRYHGG